MEYVRIVDAGWYAVRAMDLRRERDSGQTFVSICVVANLARLLDRRKSVVMIGWKRAGKELYACRPSE